VIGLVAVNAVVGGVERAGFFWFEQPAWRNSGIVEKGSYRVAVHEPGQM
jgi:hypothetical protein